MSAILARNSYGKRRVRLVKVTRHADRHDVKDVTVGVEFEGDFGAAHVSGDNSAVLPTDTMKNTVYALARQHPTEVIEEFGITLARHFLIDNAALSRVRVELTEHPWTRITVGDRPHRHAFSRAGGGERVATVTGTRDGMTVEAGVDNLLVLKTTGSAFEAFPRDRYTTLRETSDRILATAVSASWVYAHVNVPFRVTSEQIRQVLLETFAEHESRSVQHTAYAMGEAALAQCPDITEIRLSLPNKHHLPVDLTPFGLDNPNEIFVATEEPFGLIEATVRRA